MSDILDRLADVLESRKGGDPEDSYVSRLFSRGEDAILKKIGEEATEAVMAAKDGDRLRIVGETADLWFHCLIMLAHYGLRPSDVLMELRRREGISGIDEKSSRGDNERIEAERKKAERMKDFLFCRIVRGEIPSRKVYEDDDVLAFHDIRPIAPVHFLIVPKLHVATLYDCDASHGHVLGKIMALSGRLAQEQGAPDGFCAIINTGR